MYFEILTTLRHMTYGFRYVILFSFSSTKKGKVIPVLNQAPRLEDVWWS